ncbi:hypothetical protein G7068_00075 [Leucobacter viscericola]|uniref:Uncharacterized protein n=1 Tax=Leucobacter viscericola TaxID=2714935 RepID=A0A6G7XBA4_9MICO|nr:hypothetical protein [Leucobacter viscericola]QIK61782.1 hypothetical protein G7068_00075 [Leucobacter viscericola]
MVKMEYKVTGYFAQLQSYGRGKALQGYDVKRMSIVLIARDGTGWFDNPALTVGKTSTRSTIFTY